MTGPSIIPLAPGQGRKAMASEDSADLLGRTGDQKPSEALKSGPSVERPASLGQPLTPFDVKAFEAAYRRSHRAGQQLEDQGLLPLLSPSSSERSSYYDTDTAVQTPWDEGGGTSYLFPSLTSNERERLTHLWLLQHGIDRDPAFQKHLNHLMSLVRMASGYDVAILGLVDSDVYKRIATDGCPMSSQPRRDALGAHTILHPPKTVFSLSDMDNDARFAHNPNVVGADGLKSYAGIQISYNVPGSQCNVTLGSLCVASSNKRLQPTPQQQAILQHFAEVIMHAISSQASVYRQNIQLSRREDLDLLIRQREAPETTILRALEIVKKAFPQCRVAFQEAVDNKIALLGETPFQLEQQSTTNSVWENEKLIQDYIQHHNHNERQQVHEGRTVRAIVLRSRHLHQHYLTVSTSDVKFMFDVTDVMFVQSVDHIVAGVLQEEQVRTLKDSKASFLREVQHSLRTSLNGILSASEMLLDDSLAVKVATPASPSPPLSTDTQPDKLLATIDTSGRRLLSVINNLLEYDNFTEQVQAVYMPTNLHDLIEDVLEVIALATPRHSISRTNLLVEYSILHGIDGLCTDAALLRQILSALVQNALDSIEDCSEQGTVILKAWYDEYGDTLQFDVSDTGCGLKECDRERIFRPFERVDVHRQSSGLGLAFASKNSLVLGGSVSLVSSVFGQGSTFRFSLPNPVLACSRNAANRKTIVKMSNYTHSVEGPDLAASYVAQDLRRLGSQERDSRTANFVILPTSDSTDAVEERLKTLKPHQIAIGLKRVNSSLPKNQAYDESSQIVYCKLPVCRNHLVAAMDQATSVLASRELAIRPALEQTPSGRSVMSRMEISKLRLLLVDDNVLNLTVLQAFCKRRKYHHYSAGDGNQAYDTYIASQLSGEPCTFVVMDLQMPISDGVEATLRIRAYERANGLPTSFIYMVTGQSSDTDRARALAAGCNGYFVKPLRIKALDDLVAGHFYV